MGAQAQGMGYATSCLTGVWSLTNNIAGLAGTDHAAAGASYHALPSFTPFNRMAAVVAIPVSTGTAGVRIFRFGDDLYNEHVLSIGFANSFGLASLGLQVNYIQYHADGIGTSGAVSANFGGIATLTPELRFGAYAININQPVINHQTEERVPTRLVAGLAFRPSERIFVASEIEKDLAFAPAWRSGLEYWFSKKAALRTGFQCNPEVGFAGMGFKVRRLTIDYALQINETAGPSHEASVTYRFETP